MIYFSPKGRLLIIGTLLFFSGRIFSQGNDINPEQYRRHIREHIHLMTFSPVKHDEHGRLFPLQYYGETLDRSISFICNELHDWFEGAEILFCNHGHPKRSLGIIEGRSFLWYRGHTL